MLSDRDYYRHAHRPSDSGKKAIWWLIGINAVMFIMLDRSSNLYASLMLWSDGIRDLKLYELVTSMFLHANFSHILFNMWGVFLFGSLVAPHLGAKKFVTLYMISGIVGSLLWLLFNWDSPYPVVGASGAVFGVMLAAAMMEPNQEFIMLLFPVPIKAKTMVIVYGVIEIVSEMSIQDNIAHLAHLGGIVGAYLFLKLFYKGHLAWDPLSFLHAPRGTKPPKQPKGWSVHDATEKGNYRGEYNKNSYSTDKPNKPVSPREVDRILDKISQSGINSLTDDERNALKQAREQLRR
jgi:rhomboid family protein